MVYRTKRSIEVRYGWLNKRVDIPAGSRCIPATNLPEGGFWLAELPEYWPEAARSWAEDYGIHIASEEVLQQDD